MGRKKVNVQWIPDKSTRCKTYKKRCRALMKKARDLVKVSGAKLSMVLYGEDAGAQPEVWPSTAEAARLFKKFREMPDSSSYKKTTTQLQYLKDRFIKVTEQVKNSETENCERDTSALLHEHMIGQRPGLIGTTDKEVLRLKDMVDTRKSIAIARLQQLGVGQGTRSPLMLNGGELGVVVCSAFAGSSGGPSGSGCNVMQAFNQGSTGLGFSWTHQE